MSNTFNKDLKTGIKFENIFEEYLINNNISIIDKQDNTNFKKIRSDIYTDKYIFEIKTCLNYQKYNNNFFLELYSGSNSNLYNTDAHYYIYFINDTDFLFFKTDDMKTYIKNNKNVKLIIPYSGNCKGIIINKAHHSFIPIFQGSLTDHYKDLFLR